MRRQTLRGQELMLWLGDKVIAASTSCKVQLAADTEDAGSKDDGLWGAPEVVGMKWNASNESFDCVGETTTNDEAYNELYDKMIAGDPVKVTIGKAANYTADGIPEGGWTAPTPSLTAPTYEGMAIITSLDRDMTKGSKTKISLSLEGVGMLKKVTAGA